MIFVDRASNPLRWICAWAIAASIALVSPNRCSATVPDEEPAGYECDLVRKFDIMHGDQWQRAIAELGGWLATQTIYSPAEVRRIKVRFNDRVAAMSSYDIEYLLDSIEQKMRLLDTPQAQRLYHEVAANLQRATMQQRQQGVVDRQGVLADRGAAQRQATAEAAKAAASRLRSAPSHSPYRNGTGSAPFADVKLRSPVTFMMGIGM